jgi:hypothetical protein
MLAVFLEKAAQMKADRIEIEYRDGAELVTAFRGPAGIGIGWVNATDRDTLFREMWDLEKKRTATIDGSPCHLTFSEYESFGEPVYVVGIKRQKKAGERTQRIS